MGPADIDADVGDDGFLSAADAAVAPVWFRLNEPVLRPLWDRSDLGTVTLEPARLTTLARLSATLVAARRLWERDGGPLAEHCLRAAVVCLRAALCDATPVPVADVPDDHAVAGGIGGGWVRSRDRERRGG